MVKFGVIGFGNMGTDHSQNLHKGNIPGAKLEAICDIAPARREKAAQLYPDVKIFENTDALFAANCVDAVIIAVPHYEHPPIAKEAFAHSLNVLTEKPAGVYTAQVLEMMEAAKKSDKVFGIMYNQRTNPLYQKLRSMIQSGMLGNLKRVQWTITDWYRPQSYHNSCSWRSTWKTEGGGALINQNPHQLDLWQWMFGMPDKIMSHVSFGKYYDIEVEDDVTAFMQYDSGLTGVYITSTGETPGTNRLEVACDMGRVVIENGALTFDRNEVSEREFNKTFTGVFGNPPVWHCSVPTQGRNEQHAGILRNFTNAIEKGTELLAPGEDGIKGLTISNSIHLSAWTNDWVDVKNFPHQKYYDLLQEKIKNSTVVKNVEQKTAETEGTY